MHGFVCNDARKTVRGVDLGGSAFRSGRFFLYGASRPRIRAHWDFWHNLNWLEAYLRIGGEDPFVSFGLILPRLAYLSFGFAVPTRWLSLWMTEDRVFALKFGYVSSIVRAYFAYAQHAEDCGMTDYYRRQEPRRYTNLQLWPGWEFVLRFPPVLRWLFGREHREKTIIETKPIVVELDGRRYEGTWSLEHWQTTRDRWPWPYAVWVGSDIRMPHPPQFAGKGENSWDCGDDGIYGMGSRATSPAEAVGEYVKAVLQSRERYGMPSPERVK